jgi:hypothetical protein
MKTIRKIGMALFAVSMCVSLDSCDTEPEQEPEQEIQIPAISNWDVKDKDNLTEEACEASFSFTANFKWTITVTYSDGQNDWCTVTPNKGNEGYQYVRLNILKNDTYENRVATISLICKDEKKSFRVVQKGSSKPEKIQVEEAGTLGEKLSDVNSDVKSLIIEGYINGDDIADLREFYYSSHSLKSLDLLNVNIVKGGSFEYKADYGFAGVKWEKQTCDDDNVIPANMFNNGFRGLEELILPHSATSIGTSALENCVSLKRIELPKDVITIGSGAFKNCWDLESINLPKTITSIGAGAFWQCNSLKSISIPEGVTKIAGTTFYQCRNIASISLPESLTEIEPMAFSQCCWKLSHITIPKNVKKIGYQAFYECNKLTRVTCLAETAPEISHRLSDNSLIYAFDEGYVGTLVVPKFCYDSYFFSDWRKFFSISEMNY